jgi:autoinducer 2-degrading protein
MSSSRTSPQPTGRERESCMVDDLYWVFTLKVKPGQLSAFRELVTEIVAASQEEPGTLAYQYSISGDEQTVHIFERYRDSAAFVSHVEQTFGGYAERFLSMVTIVSLVVYGDPDAEARKALDSFAASYMTLFAGFAR